MSPDRMSISCCLICRKATKPDPAACSQRALKQAPNLDEPYQYCVGNLSLRWLHWKSPLYLSCFIKVVRFIGQRSVV